MKSIPAVKNFWEVSRLPTYLKDKTIRYTTGHKESWIAEWAYCLLHYRDGKHWVALSACEKAVCSETDITQSMITRVQLVFNKQKTDSEGLLCHKINQEQLRTVIVCHWAIIVFIASHTALTLRQWIRSGRTLQLRTSNVLCTDLCIKESGSVPHLYDESYDTVRYLWCNKDAWKARRWLMKIGILTYTATACGLCCTILYPKIILNTNYKRNPNVSHAPLIHTPIQPLYSSWCRFCCHQHRVHGMIGVPCHSEVVAASSIMLSESSH